MASSSSTTYTICEQSVIAGFSVGIVRILAGNGKAEHSTTFAAVFKPQPPLVEFDDRTADGQPDPHAFRLGGVKRRKNPFAIGLIDTMPLVADRNLQHPPRQDAGSDTQTAALDRNIAHRLDPVLDQVEQHLF